MLGIATLEETLINLAERNIQFKFLNHENKSIVIFKYDVNYIILSFVDGDCRSLWKEKDA